MNTILSKNGADVNTSSAKNALFTPINTTKRYSELKIGERLTLTKQKKKTVATIGKDNTIQIAKQLITEEIPWQERKSQNMMIADIIDELSISRPVEKHLQNHDSYHGSLKDYALEGDAQKLRDCASVLSLETYHGKVLDKKGHDTGKTVTKKYAEAMNSCGKRFCPICTWRTSVNKGAELYKFLDTMLETRKDVRDQYRFAFMTFTIPNCKGEELDEKLDKMLKAFPAVMKDKSLRYKKDGKTFNKVVGTYKAIEITYNPNRNDYHPHIHAIVAFDPNAATGDLLGNIYSNKKDKSKDRASQKLWNALWSSYVDEDCDHNALDIKLLDRELKLNARGQKRISKLEFKEYKKKVLSACAEITKYTWKFSDFIALGEETYQGNYSYDTGFKLRKNPKTGEISKVSTNYPARGIAGQKKPEYVLMADRKKLREALYWILSATYNRRLHEYTGVLKEHKMAFTKELEELKEQCKRQEIPESKVKAFQGKDRMVDTIDGQMVIRTNELDDSGNCRIMYIM